MEIPSLKSVCFILCVKAMPTNPTQENWPGTCFMVEASQVTINITHWLARNLSIFGTSSRNEFTRIYKQ